MAKAGSWRRFRALGVWAAAAALAAGIAVSEGAGLFAPPPRTDSHGHTIGQGPRYLVRVPMEQLTAVEIAVGEGVWRFDRGADGVWRHGGDDGTDASARIEQAMGMFGRAQITREIGGSRDVKRYGVLTPEVSVSLFADDPESPAARYFFGDVAPDELSRYVLLFGEFLVVTVPEYHTANLTGLTADFDPR